VQSKNAHMGAMKMGLRKLQPEIGIYHRSRKCANKSGWVG